MPEAILGISAFYHDSAAALLIDGRLIAAAQEERFSRKKHDADFPLQAIRYVLQEGGLSIDEVQHIAFYEKPLIKWERLLETYHAFAPRGLKSFLTAMPVWIREKLFYRNQFSRKLKELGKVKARFYFPEHHLSHAASAFYPSPYKEAAILTIDGVGEWNTLIIGKGSGNRIEVLRELHFPHSLGLLYSAFTFYLGFEVNGGEYKLMGLAAYGDQESRQTQLFQEQIEAELIDLRPDGSFLLNQQYFDYATGLQMVVDKHWNDLFGISRRKPKGKLEQVHANLALAIQRSTEKVVWRLAETALKVTGSKNLVMAGGVALNGVANGKLLNMPGLQNLWIQPAAGDAGGALGAAYAIRHIVMDNQRNPVLPDAMQGAFLGPEYSHREIEAEIRKHPLNFRLLSDQQELLNQTCSLLTEGKIVGWFQGRMEFGPRALGNRSILADPRNPDMQRRINLSIKFRESFRPFAPSVLEEDVAEYFDLNQPSPYMLLVKPLHKDRCRLELPPAELLMERLHQQRSDLPGITHVDYTARIQTVSKTDNSLYWQLLQTFKAQTGYGVLINTSFNVKDEPIVCSPADAIRCFMQTRMDALVLGNFLVLKPNLTS